MKLSLKINIIVLLSIGLASCERSTSWDLETQDESFLVVEAILTNEDLIQQIQLSQTFSNLNGSIPTGLPHDTRQQVK